MRKLEDIVHEFEDSTRNNEELAKFIKEFSGYFFAQIDERDETIDKMEELLERSSSIIKEARDDTSMLISKMEQPKAILSKVIAKGLFWIAMKKG